MLKYLSVARYAPKTVLKQRDLATLTPTSSAAPLAPDGLILEEANSLRPLFVFNNATPFTNGAILSYTLQVSTQADFSDVTGSVSNLPENDSGRTSWRIERDLAEITTYYWRVRASEGNLIGPFSATQEFNSRSSLIGDFNGDNGVDFTDFFALVEVFQQPVDASNAIFDLNGDNAIDFTDFFILVENFGTTAGDKYWTTIETTDPDAVLSLKAIGGTQTDHDGLITVAVEAENINALKAYGLVLRYDYHSVEFQHAAPGSNPLLEDATQDTRLFRILSESPGELVLGNGLIDANPVSGNGSLALLHFRLIGSANEAYFHLAEAYLSSPDQKPRRVGQLQSIRLTPQAYLFKRQLP
jgi:hypothetical protein